ncbi:SAM-dependent methyltransferase [Tenacibaculum sp. 190524A02b]|uniref:SAM-dependent methyltransferase n=2 Tax=Tenacibaculum vairaonense TaxID=3137860 RepID=A0ABM9PPP5_9FLAO
MINPFKTGKLKIGLTKLVFMYFFSTEVTSSKINSDRPLFLRTKKAYEIVSDYVSGKTLEIGCGEGYGVALYYSKVSSLTLIDKSSYSVELLKKKYPEATVIQQKIPPLKNIPNNYYDTIISFQVIEHIKNDSLFLKEIHRVLKPEGKVFLSTPNANKSIARNPWHYREYTFSELQSLTNTYFKDCIIKGIEGNKKTDEYYNNNGIAVSKLLKLDIFNLQKRMPAILLRIPYEILNRINRRGLLKKYRKQIENLKSEDYTLNVFSDKTLDFFCILEK